MYNLLVHGRERIWDRSAVEYDLDRFLEYTVDELRENFEMLDQAIIAKLEKLPALFAYETGLGAPARVGRINTIKKRGNTVSIMIKVNRMLRAIDPKRLKHISWDLGIKDWELNRTHWAVKDVDLMEILRAEGYPGQPTIFLAHASKDKQQVRELYAALKGCGFDPWLDEIHLLPGQIWKVEIERAIREAGVFIACLSSRAVGKRGFVQSEFRTALKAYAERPADAIWLIPVKLDECDVPDLQIPSQGVSLRDLQWVELRADNGFGKLTAAISEAAEKLIDPEPWGE